MFFLYDIEGISGFLVGKNPSHYIYVKDATGNIISILDNFVEVARYEYDPFGKCTIVKDNIGLGKLNPFRWKGQYYDDETGLYYIDGRYYSPIIKQFINPDNPENITSKLDNIYGIYPYSITTSNTINIYNYGYTIETSVPLVYDPPKLNWWTYFWRVTWNEYWNSPLGKILAGRLFICALVLSYICSFICNFINNVWT